MHFKVLSVEPDRRRLLLTHKKTMVESDLPLITDYSDAKPGVSTHGFVTAIKDFGCLVTFYNNVKGLVPRTELGQVLCTLCNISNMRCSVSSPDETPRRELKIRRAAEYF